MGSRLKSVMLRMEPGNGIRVVYDSSRGNGTKDMEGEVVECLVREDKCRLRFRRNDGQMCVVKKDDSLLSLGSHHPYTGDVIRMERLEGYVEVPYAERSGL